MDADQFDTITARLAATLSRRRSLGVLGALGVASAVSIPEIHAGKKGKKGKRKKGKGKGNKGTTLPPTAQCPASCPVCQACVDGRTCTVQPDGSACDGTGQCSAGVCNPQPICASTGADCDIFITFCCNGDCDTSGGDIFFGTCVGTGGQGTRCKKGSDCTSGTCVAYRCT